MAFTKLELSQRALSITPNAIVPPRGVIFGTVVFMAIFGFFAWLYTPNLVRDWMISQDPVVIQDARVSNGECTTRQGVFVSCSADVTYGARGNPYNRHIELAFLDLHSGDYQVDVVVNRNDPGMATLSLGLDMLWSRTATLAVILLLLLGAPIIGGGNILRARKAQRASTTPARLDLVPLHIANTQTRRGVTVVNYHALLPNGKQGPQGTATFAAGEAPLTQFDDKGKLIGVGVKHPDSPLPALLDEGLARISLTERERREALAQLAVTAEAAPAAAPAKKRMPAPLRVILGVVVMLVVMAVAAGGYWLWYVTSSNNRFDALGMEINAILPEPLNAWGCDQLQQRFMKERAPFGCTAADHTSWK